MTINWTGLAQLRNRQEVHKALGNLITPKNYGTGPDQWCLTELITTGTNASEEVFRLLAGIDQDGKEVNDGAMKDAGGLPLTFKLRVLSRQACFETKDGRGINDWDTTDIVGENDNQELCPAFDELPVEGDVVWVKGNAYTHCPVTGDRVWKKVAKRMIARFESEVGRKVKPFRALWRHSKYPVDADGCITVPYYQAVQLLRNNGFRIPMYQFTSGPRRGDPKKVRVITNWHFKEVTPDDEKKKTPKDKPHANAAAVN